MDMKRDRHDCLNRVLAATFALAMLTVVGALYLLTPLFLNGGIR